MEAGSSRDTSCIYVASSAAISRAQATTFEIRVRRDITDDWKRQRRHAIIPNFSNYRFIPPPLPPPSSSRHGRKEVERE